MSTSFSKEFLLISSISSIPIRETLLLLLLYCCRRSKLKTSTPNQHTTCLSSLGARSWCSERR